MAATVKLVRAGKVLLVVTLISIFLKYFGIKSWERYKREKVLVIKSWAYILKARIVTPTIPQKI